MNYKLIVFFVFWAFISARVVSQTFNQNANFFVQKLVQDSPLNTSVHVVLHGNPLHIKELINQHGDKYKYHHNQMVSATIKVQHIFYYLNSIDVKRLEYSPNSGIPLTYKSVEQTGVNLVKQGASPLSESYTGKGVIIGIIDTGIDFTHPDFKDSLGNTRIISIWDQRLAFDSALTPSKYGYGKAWDSTAINNGTCTHTEPANWYGHGTNVSGIAAGNGNSVNKSIADYSGFAPDAKLIVVASNFSANNWTATVADAVDYIFSIADSLNMPVVINASLGQITGSHDGLDGPAQLISQQINAKLGRAMVCAAGNFGAWPDFHLGYQVNTDTSFTWFTNPPNSSFGSNTLFFEAWADTSQFNQVQFALGASDTSNGNLVGKTQFSFIHPRLNVLFTDSIFNDTGAFIARVQTFAELQGSRYLLQVLLSLATPKYFYDFMSTGQGSFDIWSSGNFGYANIFKLNSTSLFSSSRMQHYKNPDNLQSMVSSWACLPNVITVGNYINQSSFLDIDSTLQTFNVVSGARATSSSRGPTRLGVLKPDISAPGDYTLASGLSTDLADLKNIPALRSFVGLGGFHRRVGGTSMASPAVSGIVALLMEKCSQIDVSQIQNHLYSTAYADSLTGSNLPNYAWGRGKVNGFNTLVNSNISPEISFLPDSFLCPNDSVSLATTTNFTSYLWSTGTTLASLTTSTSGKYSLTVTNQYGCSGTIDSIAVNNYPAPLIQLGNDTIICREAELTLQVDTNLKNILWFNSDTQHVSIIKFPDSLVFVHAQNNFGCFGFDTLKVNYFESPQFNLGPDTSICNTDTLSLAVSNSFAVQWFDSSLINTKVIWQPGLYFATVTDSNQCKATDTIRINSLLPLPHFSLGNDVILCQGDSINLQGPPNMLSYFWNTNNVTQNQTLKNVGNFSLQITDSNMCNFSDTIVVKRIQPLPTFILDSNYTICTGDSMLVQGPNYYQYLWSIGSNNQSIYVKNSGLLSVTVTDTVGCNVVSSAQVLLNKLPVFSLGSDTGFCSNVRHIMNLNAPTNMVNYLWVTGPDDAQVSFCNGNPSALCDYSIPADGKIWVEVTDSNTCKYADTLKVENLQPPIFSLGNDTAICANEPVLLNYQFSNPNFSSFLWSDSSTSPVKVINSFGKFSLAITGNNGCSEIDSLSVIALPLPQFSLGNDTLLPPSITNYTIGSGIGNVNYLWNTGSVDSSITISASDNYPQTYWLNVTSNLGCIFSDSITINWYAWSVPEANSESQFSMFPNPTQINDVVSIKSNLTINKIDIYNSLGQCVYSQRVNNSLGIIHIQQTNLAAGTYYVKAQFKDYISTQILVIY